MDTSQDKLAMGDTVFWSSVYSFHRRIEEGAKDHTVMAVLFIKKRNRKGEFIV
ncbi:MAG TPA: hypothetical protein VK031_08145 [Tissierellaceae bacterium]|nr:hypothetical protein [Tissierellaceae bacterium]